MDCLAKILRRKYNLMSKIKRVISSLACFCASGTTWPTQKIGDLLQHTYLLPRPISGLQLGLLGASISARSPRHFKILIQKILFIFSQYPRIILITTNWGHQNQLFHLNTNMTITRLNIWNILLPRRLRQVLIFHSNIITLSTSTISWIVSFVAGT